MNPPTMLTHILKLNLDWHLAGIQWLSCLIIALFKVKTVNFVELAPHFQAQLKWIQSTGAFSGFSKKFNSNPTPWLDSSFLYYLTTD